MPSPSLQPKPPRDAEDTSPPEIENQGAQRPGFRQRTQTLAGRWFFTGRFMLWTGILLFAVSLLWQVTLRVYETRKEPVATAPQDVDAGPPKSSLSMPGQHAPNLTRSGPRGALAVAVDVSLDWFLSFMKELGAVLVVSFLIRELIEKGQHEAWQEALSRRVEDTLSPAIKQVQDLSFDLGITLRNPLALEDEDAKKQLTDKVLRPDFIRRGYVLTLTLEGNFGEKYVKVTTDTNYILENVTKSDRPYTIRGWIDIAQDAWFPANERSRFTFLAFGPAELKAQDCHRPIDAAQLSDSSIVDPSNLALELEYPVKPDIPAGGKYFSQLTAVQYMRCQDQFIWNMAYVTERLDVVVRLGGGLTWKRFDVRTRPMHHGGKFDVEPADASPCGQEPRTWTINGVLLPNQGVQIWWSPRSDSPPATPTLADVGDIEVVTLASAPSTASSPLAQIATK